MAPPVVHDVLSSPGVPLEPSVRERMESRLGHDFSRVRVHTGDRAAESARSVSADAYTVGADVVFDRGRYEPFAPEGERLLAHELAHVVQQTFGVGRGRGSIPILSPDSPAERDAQAASDRGATVTGQPGQPALARQPAPVLRPPPARPPLRVIPGGRTDTDPARRPSVPEGQRYADPSPYDQSIEANIARSNARAYRERVIREQERPEATLDRGGDAADDFVTEHGTRQYTWAGGPGGGGSASVRVRRFHVLDAIEHAVGRASSEQDLQAIADQFLPMVGLLNQAIEISEGRQTGLRHSQAPLSLWWNVPVFPPGFDPGARARVRVFETAARTRAQQVPALAQSRLIPRTRRMGGCRLEPIAPLGDDPLSNLYCHAVTGSPYSYKITIEQSAGQGLTQRWAEIDALRGNTWFECKCGYEALLTGAARGEAVAQAVLNRLDGQVLNHLDIARTCGLDYRFIVSNERVRTILEQRWFGNVVIDVRPWADCD